MPRARRLLVLLATACALAGTAAAVSAQTKPRLSARGTLSLTPYMGVDTWYAFGAHIDEAKVTALGDAIAARGLQAIGYRYVWLDGGWWNGARDQSGRIVTDPRLWPHGLAWLTTYLHARGLLVGIYTDAGRAGCGRSNAGSYGHYQDDVNTFAAWGFDAVKVDFCGGTDLRLDPRIAYGEFKAAILSDTPQRPMLLNVCNPVLPHSLRGGYPPLTRSVADAYAYGSVTANSWRTGGDVGGPGQVSFSSVLGNITTDSAHPEAAGPGHWNDPDYIVPDAGMTAAESQAQFTMWSILAAPLMLSEDVTAMPALTLAMVSNREAIAIDQDGLGRQGQMVARSGNIEVWVKPLAHGDRAVALLNVGRRSAAIRTRAGQLGLRPGRTYRLRDIWARRTTRTSGVIARTVPGDSAVLLRISAG